MPQVIIVSNRLPVTVKKVNGKLKYETSMGGVATGLSSYITNRKNKWIGWPGIPSEELSDAEKHAVTVELAKHNCVPVFLSRRQIDDFYNGYSNSLLWPLFHNLQMADKLADHERWWKAYRAVNRAFADSVFGIIQPNSTIWVHDYQLMLLPEMLKVERPNNHIGFFLHIPFPEHRLLKKLPEAVRLIKGVLGADLVGLHTKQYVSQFIDNVQSHGLGIANGDQLFLADRTVRVTDFPMGIDYEKFTGAHKLPAVKKAAKQFRRKYRGRRIIAGVDRLDITKGFVERLTAYNDFLAQNPKLHGKVVFVLVGAPSRGEIDAYKKLSAKVEKQVAAINARFGTPKWQPVDYNNQGLPFEEVTALFQVADVAFIAPLRDGMNLVAKEFIASKRKGGVLVLSDTAGAAQELQDAVLVNHKIPATLVAGLEQALHMSKREIRGRLKRMQSQLATNNVHTWAGNFMQNLQKPILGNTLRTQTLKGSSLQTVTAAYDQSKKRLLLLDYDGTLRPFGSDYHDGFPGKKLRGLLQLLADDPRNEIVMISGRSAPDLERFFEGLPLHLVAEHGAMTKRNGGKAWKTLERAESKWKKQIAPVLEKYAALTPKAAVEAKPHSLVWHYRQSPSYYAQKNIVILKKILKPLLKSYGLAVFQGNKILEIKNPSINKGAAVRTWLRDSHDFVMVAGDDYTDEDMFMMVPADSVSIKIGSGRTSAQYRVKNTEEMLRILAKLAK
ncbi:MAG: hypothetical protein JWM81_696 [Candidatus Saccharibacteria bacterium]|nr:hypothetical protein [Candidatus Saccharibacteria bacterium]